MSDTWTADKPHVFEHVELLVRQRVAVQVEAEDRAARGRLVWLGDGQLGFQPFRGSAFVPTDRVVFEAQAGARTWLFSCAVKAWSPGLPWRIELPEVVHTYAVAPHPHKGVTITLRLPLATGPTRRTRRIAA